MAKHKILWQHFPKHSPCSDFLKEVVSCFDEVSAEIASLENVGQVSNDVLAKVRGGLQRLGFLVETSKTAEGKIKVPVLYGANGKVEKAFEADAYHPTFSISPITRALPIKNALLASEICFPSESNLVQSSGNPFNLSSSIGVNRL